MSTKSKKNIVIITGGRNFKSMTKLIEAVNSSGFKIDEIVHGGAKGADSLAAEYAKKNKIPCKEFPAKWNDLKAEGAKIKTNSWGKEYNCLAAFTAQDDMVEYATHAIILDSENQSLAKKCRDNLIVFEFAEEEIYNF